MPYKICKYNSMEKLTAKEEEVLGFFWNHGEMCVKDILDFYDEPRPHFNTISTIVRSLEEKGYVDVSERYFENARQSNLYTVHKI